MSQSSTAPALPPTRADDDFDDENSSLEIPSRKAHKSFTPLNVSNSSLEDVEVGSTTGRRGGRKAWWKSIFTGLTRRFSMARIESLEDEADGALLGEYRAGKTKKQRRKSTCLQYYMYRSVSALAFLTLFLVVIALLSYIILNWRPDGDHVLDDWGRPGSSTEGLAGYPTDFTRDILPIPCHSHNDYWRRVPLFSALRAGCTGVEADVWYLDDDLYIGHNTASLTRNRTFQTLYIDPLVKILEHQNPQTEFYNGTQHGVFDTDSEMTMTLLVDVKTAGAVTWPIVLAQLQPLRDRDWLTFVENDIIYRRPITVVGTGNTPFDVLTLNTTYRDAFFDAPLDTMWEASDPSSDPPSILDHPNESDSTPPLTDAGQGHSGTTPSSSYTTLNSYYASTSFADSIGHLWRGSITERQLEIIRGQVRGAHRRGLKARYWELPAWPIGVRNHVWDTLMKEGVDVLNVDDLKAAAKRVWV